MPAQQAEPEVMDLLAFLDAAPTPYHAVRQAAKRLDAAGFSRLDEREAWQLAPGSKGYVVRGGGSLVAFALGQQPVWEAGALLLGAHTDSPNLRLKPAAELESVGYRQLSIEVYGGVLFSTWLDRDLSIAGRVILGSGDSKLVELPGAPCRIPNLAIHLNRDVNTAGLILNAQTQLAPVFGLERNKDDTPLYETIAAALGVDVKDIASADLCLFDSAPAALGGSNGEFVLSARLDNLASCHAALCALLAAGPSDSSRVVALYDHEEVGSQSAAGARSSFLQDVLRRLIDVFPGAASDALARTIARSLLVSLDMAHAVHPNYADKHDRQHRPMIGKGPAIKTNVNQSYATDAPAMALFAEACRRCDVTPQHFVSRNDMPCGSTIGPITAARLGLRTVDAGSTMLGMHSCREMAGSADVPLMIRVLSKLLEQFTPPNPAL